MKKFLFILLFAAIAASASAQVNFVDETTDRVREMAVKQEKLVFIDLYAPWCPPCRAMEKQVFSRKDVGDFMNTHFINAKYNVDELTGKQLSEKYKADGIPTYLIFNTAGDLLGRIVGASDAEQFLLDIQKIVSGKLPKN